MANFFGQVTSMFKNLVRGEDYEFKEITKDNPSFKDFKDLSQEEDDAIKNSVVENYFKTQGSDESVGGFLGDSISKSYTEFVYGAISTSKPARLANYRKMANFPEINDAIDEICDASINYDENNQLVKLKIKNKTLGDVRSKELQEKFEEYVDLFDLEHNFYDFMRTFVIDGQLAWELIVDPDKKELGLIGVNQVPNESYDFLVDNHGRKKGIVVKDKLYNVGLAGVGVSMQGGMKVQDASDFFKEKEQKTRQSQDNTGDNKVESSSDDGIYLPFEQVAYVDSGLYSANKLIVFPILEKARRAYRQLSLIEDAIIIYRLVRAPERWVFNVDTGDLPRPKAEQETHNLMRRFQVKRFYNPETGSVSNDYDPHSMLESFWFPKSTGSTGTTVSTIGGTVQWTSLPDLEYFQKKLFRSLKVPNRRFADPAVNVEKSNAISYEEYSFAKFVMRNLERFAVGLEKSFETHLKLTGIWERFEMSNRDYTVEFTPPASYDLYEQQKLIELKYKNYDIITKDHPELSKEVAMKQCLGYTEEDIRENAEHVEKEMIRKALNEKKVANIATTGNPILGIPEAGAAPGGAPK